MTNGGTKLRNRARDFQYHDKLPRSVRERIADACDDMDSENFYHLARRYGFDEAEMHEYLDERLPQIRAEIVREHYGYDHPQASQTCPWPENPQSKRQRLTRHTQHA